jgi:hypothetical protein
MQSVDQLQGATVPYTGPVSGLGPCDAGVSRCGCVTVHVYCTPNGDWV